jgi:hypothetical protein
MHDLAQGEGLSDKVVGLHNVKDHGMCWQFIRSTVMKGGLTVCGAALTACALASPNSTSSSLHALSQAQCAPPSNAGYHGPLPTTWDTYKPYVRACPLASAKASPKLWLLTIFAQPYLDDHPGETTWPNFPRPQLVDADGHCLARLPELFPFDEPRTLSLRYESSAGTMPGEIRVHVSNPAMGGDYDLPVLRWMPAQHAYIAQNATDEYTKDDMTCRN